MAEQHEQILKNVRKKYLKLGFKEFKTPIPTYRPDYFGRKFNKFSKVSMEIIIEAEIESTIFSEHTTHQLLSMHEYIQMQHKKKIQTRGFLIVPKKKYIKSLALSLLGSLFPRGTKIKVLQ